MYGTILYPLNVLKKTHPEIYNEHVKKYEGREKLLSTEIPTLKCLWNDVIHFTAIHPQVLKDNLAQANIAYDPMSWFKIPISLIKGKKSTAFTYHRNQNLIPTFKKYEVFDPNRMEVYRAVPAETIEYYKQKKAEDTKPLLFHLIPHILYTGSIDTKNLEIITI